MPQAGSQRSIEGARRSVQRVSSIVLVEVRDWLVTASSTVVLDETVTRGTEWCRGVRCVHVLTFSGGCTVAFKFADAAGEIHV